MEAAGQWKGLPSGAPVSGLSYSRRMQRSAALHIIAGAGLLRPLRPPTNLCAWPPSPCPTLRPDPAAAAPQQRGGPLPTCLGAQLIGHLTGLGNSGSLRCLKQDELSNLLEGLKALGGKAVAVGVSWGEAVAAGPHSVFVLVLIVGSAPNTSA